MNYIEKMKNECEKQIDFFTKNLDNSSEKRVTKVCGMNVASKKFILQVFDDTQHNVERELFGDNYSSETEQHNNLCDIRSDFEMRAFEILETFESNKDAGVLDD